MKKSKLLSILAGAFLAPAMTALAPVSAQAAESETALVVTYTWGAEEVFMLSEKPEISFGGDQLKITAPDVTAERKFADIQTFTFEQRSKPSSIENVAETVVFTFNDGENVAISGLPAGAPCALYDTKGICVLNAQADGNGNFSASLSSFAKGVYILIVNNSKTYKLNVR